MKTTQQNGPTQKALKNAQGQRAMPNISKTDKLPETLTKLSQFMEYFGKEVQKIQQQGAIREA